MLGLLENTTINTILLIGISFVIIYFVVFDKKPTTTGKKPEIKDRSIKQSATESNDIKSKAIVDDEIKAAVAQETEASVSKVLQQKSELSLAQYNATVAKMAMLSSNYIQEQYPIKKKVTKKSFLDDLVAEVETNKEVERSISSKFAKVMGDGKTTHGEEVKDQFIKEGEFIKEDEVTNSSEKAADSEVQKDGNVKIAASAAAAAVITATTVAVSELVQPKKADPKPFLADFNATEAMTALEAQQYVASMPKAPKPFLAAFNATEAVTLLESKQYIAAMPKAPRPFLAAFNATESIALLESQQYVASMPKAPKPFLAAFNATGSITLLESQQFVASMPKAPKPFLAAFNATESMTLLESQQYVASMPKAPSPFLAAFNATESMTLLESQKYVASLPKVIKPSTPFLANYNATTASTALTSQNYIEKLRKSTKPIKETQNNKQQEHTVSSPASIKTTKSNLANIDATTAYQLLLSQARSQENAFDSDVEVEIEEEELSSPATTPSTSTSSLNLVASKFIPSAPSAQQTASSVNTTPTQPQFNPYSNYSTPWIIGGNAMMAEPTSLENVPVVVGEKKKWTREQKIEKQIQSHMPKMKNRCDYWPNCTNKHCKYSHPITPCRVGDGCPFGKRCSFIHPEDYIEPPKRRHTTTDATAGRKNSYHRKPNQRSNSSFTHGKNNTPSKSQQASV